MAAKTELLNQIDIVNIYKSEIQKGRAYYQIISLIN